MSFQVTSGRAKYKAATDSASDSVSECWKLNSIVQFEL